VEGTESTSVNRPLRYFELDNLGRTTADLLYDGDGVTLTVTNGVPVAPSSTLLRAKTTTEYDERDRAFRTKQYSVDGSGNVPGNYLKSEQWFDARGNVIKSFSPTGPTTKLQYDGPGRLMNVFVTDASDDTGYGDADDVTGDRVVEQTEYAYDLADNVILTTLRRRFHTTMGTGGLGTNNTGNFARVSYVGTYYDAAYRVTASVDVGTNAGSAYTRPSGVPGRSATTLVTSYDYNRERKRRRAEHEHACDQPPHRLRLRLTRPGLERDRGAAAGRGRCRHGAGQYAAHRLRLRPGRHHVRQELRLPLHHHLPR